MRPDDADAAPVGPAASGAAPPSAAAPDQPPEARAPEDAAAPAQAAATPRIARREFVLLLVAAAALQTLAWALLVVIVRSLFARYWDVTIPDVVHYGEVAWAFRQGHWPYSMTPFEYPPLTLVPLMIPPDVLPFARYALEFKIEMVVVFALNAIVTTWAAVGLWASSRRALAAAIVLAATVPATGLIALNRFDATVGLVIALTVLCLAYRRWALAALFVGLGFSLKLMPIVLLPLVFVLARRWRLVWRAGLAALAGMVVPFVPFLIQGGTSIFSTTVGTQTARGLQIETVAASPFLLRSIIDPGSVRVLVPQGGSPSILARGAAQVSSLAPLLVLAFVLVAYLVIWDVRDRIRETPEAVPVAILALMVAAMCGNKVLSPQHLIWVLPVVALALVTTRWSLRVPALLMFAAMILTQIVYPRMYFDLMMLRPAAIFVVVARNVVLLAVLIASIVALFRLRRDRPAED
jgi:hypothetical protein